jgi:hypothetical protein
MRKYHAECDDGYDCEASSGVGSTLTWTNSWVDEPEELMCAILQLDPGAQVQIDVVRDAKRRTLDVELGIRSPLRPSPLGGT